MSRLQSALILIAVAGFIGCSKPKQEAPPQPAAPPQAPAATQPSGAAKEPVRTASSTPSTRKTPPLPTRGSEPPPPAPPVESAAPPPPPPPPPVSVSEPPPVSVSEPPPPPPPPPRPRRPSSVVLEAGSTIDVRLVEGLSSATAKRGDRFETHLTRDLEAGGRVIARRGSTVVGRISDVDASGRVKGRAHMALTLTELKAGGESYPIRTSEITLEAGGSKGRDAKAVTGTTGLGAIIGAIAGGGKGAAIGAAIGGATGAVTVLATKGKEIELEPEQRFSFRLENDLKVRVDPSEGDEVSGDPDTQGRPQEAVALQKRIETKLNLMQNLMPQYVQRGGDQRRVQPMIEEVQRLMDAGRPQEAEAELDQIINLLRR